MTAVHCSDQILSVYRVRVTISKATLHHVVPVTVQAIKHKQTEDVNCANYSDMSAKC